MLSVRNEDDYENKHRYGWQLTEAAGGMSGEKTKKDVIKEDLKLQMMLSRQVRVKEFRGKLRWTGDLDEMRTDKKSFDTTVS